VAEYMKKQKIFISSVQRELTAEREALYAHFITDALLSSFFEPVLFEKLPADTHAPNKVYLDEVADSSVYLLLIGIDYGYQDENGVSPTEQEYNHAAALNKTILAFIKGESSVERHPKEEALLIKVQNYVSYKRFHSISELIAEVNRSLVALLKHQRLVQVVDFDAAINPNAVLADIDNDKVNEFISTARRLRGFPLREGTSVNKILSHLNMLFDEQLTNSALLAFGAEPQQFFPTAVVKCAYFHGLYIEKPIKDHRVIKGDVFMQVDQAVDFVLSKVAMGVGLRDNSNQAPMTYEIPRAVIAEAIVNAVAHREYNSNGSVQVMLFADRLEISNPGALAPELNIDKLKRTHASYPTNPFLAEVMYQAGYIERFGTGTGEILRLTEAAGLKEPEFNLEEGFKITIWRPDNFNAVNSTAQASALASALATVQATAQASALAIEEMARVVLVMEGEMRTSDIMAALELKHKGYFRDNYLSPSLEEELIEMTIPDRPSSPNQRYRLTEKGLKFKEELKA